MDAGSGARIWHSASAVHMGPVACVQAVRCVDLLTVAAEEYFTRKHLWIRVVSRTSLVTASLAVLAAASLLLIPQIGWESQRDLTHSVLAAAVAAATLYVLIRLIERPTPRLYLLLIPHGLWLLDHWDLASTRTMEKLGQTPLGGYGIVRGISSLVSATGATVGVLCLIYMLLHGWSVWKRHEGDHYDRQICSFWQQYFRALTALLLALVLFFGVMHFKGRWLQPLLFAVPFAFFCCRKKLVGHARLRWLKVVLSVLAALYLAVAAFRPSPEWMAGST